MFSNRTFLSIYKKAWKLNLKRYDEIEFINRSVARSGEKSGSWKGGKKLNKGGYFLLLNKNHPRSDRNGYVLEHICVFEKETGITVPLDCCVHHINGDKKDNRIENLCLMTKKAHTILHHLGKKRSDDFRKKMSILSKNRLSDKTKHHAYKNIDIKEMLDLRKNGEKVKNICKKYGISRNTYYKKEREFINDK